MKLFTSGNTAEQEIEDLRSQVRVLKQQLEDEKVNALEWKGAALDYNRQREINLRLQDALTAVDRAKPGTVRICELPYLAAQACRKIAAEYCAEPGDVGSRISERIATLNVRAL